MNIHKQFFKILLVAIIFPINLFGLLIKFIIRLFKSKKTKEREALAIQLIAERTRLLIANKYYLDRFSGKRRYTKAPIK